VRRDSFTLPRGGAAVCDENGILKLPVRTAQRLETFQHHFVSSAVRFPSRIEGNNVSLFAPSPCKYISELKFIDSFGNIYLAFVRFFSYA
jgi:hypothetical protein